ncbi:MAG: hypothetical protein KF683_18010 [Rubrivivax sp.]|nr:hypothetical protein [Rubrivivax sp.]
MQLLPSAIRTAAAIACLSALAAAASPSVVTLQAPGGFVTACGGISGTTGASSPGGDLQAFFLVDSSCDWQQFVAGTASAAASFSGGGANNSAQGQVGWGQLQMSAANVSPNNALFPYGHAQAGWEDQWTFNAPGLAGQAGIAHALLAVDASWAFGGFAGAAGIALQPYINSAQFTYPGGGGSIQLQGWNTSFFPNGVSQTVQLTIPFVFGQSFDFAVFMTLRAGLRSVSGVAGLSNSDAVASASWQGLSGVFVGGSPVANYTLASASGVDWTTPVPEAPSALSLLGGLAWLGWWVRRRVSLAA